MTKNRCLRILCALCALLVCISSLVSCGSQPTAVRFRDVRLSENIYKYYLSQYKDQILQSANYGQDNAAFWSMTNESGKTNEEFYSGLVRDHIITIVVCAQLFKEYGLSLSQSTVDQINDEINALIEDYGSRSEFNRAAAAYGVNEDLLREAYLLFEKAFRLYEYLYSENGPYAVTEEERDTYFREHYIRIKTIFVNTTYDFEADEEGNYVFDDEGYAITRDKTEEEIAEANAKAADLKKRLADGEAFEDLIPESDDPSSYADAYKDGFYFTNSTTYYGNVIEVASALDEGEWGVAESEYGIHFVLRLPLEDKAYTDETKSEFFDTMEEEITSTKFAELLESLRPEIELNEDIIAGISIVDTPQNQEM